MKLSNMALSLVLVCSAQAQAFHLEWMSSLIDEPFEPLNVNQLDNAAELFDCGENAPLTEFCSPGEVPYYKLKFFAEVSSDKGIQKNLYLYKEYSLIAYSDSLINLRKDGFTLVEAHINGEVFDVRKAIEESTAEMANKALVKFLNRSPKENQRKLIWQKQQQVKATVLTDSDMLSIGFEYMPTTETE